MRKAILALTLIATGVGLSGCWHDRGGYGHPGHPSDHHHHHGDDGG